MKVVEMSTGLFPDAPRVEAALVTLEGVHEVEKFDVSQLDPKNDTAWEAIATAVLGADLIVTL